MTTATTACEGLKRFPRHGLTQAARTGEASSSANHHLYERVEPHLGVRVNLLVFKRFDLGPHTQIRGLHPLREGRQTDPADSGLHVGVLSSLHPLGDLGESSAPSGPHGCPPPT